MFYKALHYLVPQCLSNLIYCSPFASLNSSIILLLQVYMLFTVSEMFILTDIYIMLHHGLYSNIMLPVRSP